MRKKNDSKNRKNQLLLLFFVKTQIMGIKTVKNQFNIGTS